MANNNLSDVIRDSLDGIRSVADSGTVIGDPITTNNGTVIIPVSKITVGFASGGVDYMPKTTDKEGNQKRVSTPCFAGGGGTGISVTPLCFLVVTADGGVTMMNIADSDTVPPAVGAIDSISSFVEKAPEIIAKIKGLFAKKTPTDELDDEALADEFSELEAEVAAEVAEEVAKEAEKEAKKAEKAAKKAEKAAQKAAKKAE